MYFVLDVGATLIGLLKNWPMKNWPVENWPVIFGLLFRCDVKFSVFQIQLTDHLEFQHF